MAKSERRHRYRAEWCFEVIVVDGRRGVGPWRPVGYQLRNLYINTQDTYNYIYSVVRLKHTLVNTIESLFHS